MFNHWHDWYEENEHYFDSDDFFLTCESCLGSGCHDEMGDDDDDDMYENAMCDTCEGEGTVHGDKRFIKYYRWFMRDINNLKKHYPAYYESHKDIIVAEIEKTRQERDKVYEHVS